MAGPRWKTALANLGPLWITACAHPQPPAPPPVAVVQGPPAAIEPVARLPRLRIIATNDFHGALEARPDATGALRGGGATLAGAVKLAEADCKLPDCATILLDGGDEFQGT